MNPNKPQPSFELPTPVQSGENKPDVSAEVAPAHSEQHPSIPAAVPSSLPQTPPLTAPTPTPPSLDPQGQSPLIADDADLIEKEWVEKAKRIVAGTKQDPYAQNREINRFKADYMKKRYNKDVKIDES
ncbi:hypothetical protein H0V99_00700 [Candidatus Saccharibacteria bacterium]|nr:hypothetical protein [Candidatus Saccharibacteria bacterium]